VAPAATGVETYRIDLDSITVCRLLPADFEDRFATSLQLVRSGGFRWLLTAALRGLTTSQDLPRVG
jgi:hypothetical protein